MALNAGCRNRGQSGKRCGLQGKAFTEREQFMASEKKPSSQADRGKVRSAEELETYGVWVKSEPQDMASQPSGDGFPGGAVPFGDGFETGFDGLGTSDAGFGSFGGDGFVPGGFVEVPFEPAHFEESPGDADEPESARENPDSGLLLRIAEELSSLRSEIKTLKGEFADIRGGSDADEDPVAFSSGGFPGGLPDASGSDRDVDEAALKELSRRNEAEAGARPDGEPDADFAGVDSTFADFPVDAYAPERELVPDSDLAADTLENDIAFLSGDSGSDVGDDEVFGAFSGELPSADSPDGMDGFEGMRIDGTDSLSALPDFGEGLDGDPLALPGAEGWDFRADGDVPGIGADSDVPDGNAGGGWSGGLPLPNDGGEEDYGPTFAEDFSSISETAGPDDGLSPDDETPAFANDFSSTEFVGFDDGLSLDEDFSTDGAPADVADPLGEGGILLDDGSDGAGAPSWVGAPFDDEAVDDARFAGEDMIISGDWLSGEGAQDDGELSGGSGAAEIAPDDGVNLPAWLVSESELEETHAEAPSEYGAESAEEDVDSVSADFPIMSDESRVAAPFEFADIPLDEPPTVGEAVLDASLGEHIPDDPVLDDISLDLGGFEMDDPSIDDSPLVREIPEGFEVDAEEAVSEIDEDIGIAPDSGKKDSTAARKDDDAAPDLSPDLRKDLKDVLSYMDGLLESLPDDKIEEFAKSKHFDTYRKLFRELGLLR